MYKKAGRWLIINPGLSAVVLTAVLIILFNLIATPLLNSGDDTFLMYTLGGGFGEAPSNLLHYSHAWNFLLGSPARSLFSAFPGINWYTVLLLFFHLLGCASILYTLIKRLNFQRAFFYFLLLFVFIESRQLLSLTFTGAAITAATGAMCLLVHQFAEKKIWARNSLFAIILLLLAGLLRLPAAILVILLFSTIALSLLERKRLFIACATAIAVIGILWGFNKLHEQYYSKHIPGWSQQEKFRQALFYSYNRPIRNVIPEGTFSDSSEQQLFNAGFLYDTAFFNEKKVDKISHAITGKRSFQNKNDTKGFYWFFIEMRVYLSLLVVCIIFLLVQRRTGNIMKWLPCLGAFIAVHIYLFLFQKITMPLHLGLLFFLFISLFMMGDKREMPQKSKGLVIIMLLALGSITTWMLIRLKKENDTNKGHYAKFLCATAVLKDNPGKLFIATDDVFPLNYFYIWNTPMKYPATNLLYKDRLINRTYFRVLEARGITNLQKEMGENKNILLVGAPLPALEKGKYPAVLSGALPGFGCLEVRQLTTGQ